MRSGAKNALIDIVRRVKQADPDGYNQPRWVDAFWRQSIFCRMQFKKGTESDRDNQAEVVTFVRFDFDYFDVEGIMETDILVHEGVRYDIKAILGDPSLKDNMTIDCTKRPPLSEDMI